MIRAAVLVVVAMAGSAAALTLTAAQPTPALAGVKPGLWELAASPASRAPSRACFADVRALGRVEHRPKVCASKVISDDGKSTVIEYSCGPAGCGQTRIDVITPRSLRIGTQGISDGLPFNYTLEAHRVGECSADASVTRH